MAVCFTEKKYEWIFHDEPCTICVSLYQELLKKYRDPQKVMACVYARPYVFNRRLGEGDFRFQSRRQTPAQIRFCITTLFRRSLDNDAVGRQASQLCLFPLCQNQ